MPLKEIIEQDGKKFALIDDESRPVYETDGKEIGYDGESLAAKLHEVNGESATRRRELKEMKDKFDQFEGIDDPAEAKKALETVANLDAKKLIEAGEVEKVKAEAIAATESQWKAKIQQQYEPALKERDKLKSRLTNEMIGNRFGQSKFIQEKIAVPSQMVRTYFGKNFTIEGDRVIAKHDDGNEIFSTTRPGEKADFDEALEILVERAPFRDEILKGRGKAGTGSKGGGGGELGSKQISRAEADRLAVDNPSELSKRLGDGYTVV